MSFELKLVFHLSQRNLSQLDKMYPLSQVLLNVFMFRKISYQDLKFDWKSNLKWNEPQKIVNIRVIYFSSNSSAPLPTKTLGNFFQVIVQCFENIMWPLWGFMRLQKKDEKIHLALITTEIFDSSSKMLKKVKRGQIWVKNIELSAFLLEYFGFWQLVNAFNELLNYAEISLRLVC